MLKNKALLAEVPGAHCEELAALPSFDDMLTAAET
jgi:hypothetical protein